MEKLVLEHQQQILKFIELYQEYISILSNYNSDSKQDDIDFLANFYRDFQVTLNNLEDVVDYFKLKKSLGKDVTNTVTHEILSQKNKDRDNMDKIIKGFLPFILASSLQINTN